MYYTVQLSGLFEEGISMKVVSFTEFRKNASEVLNLVEKGAIIRITRHGRINRENRSGGIARTRV